MGQKKVVLHAGDYCFGESNLELHTLLGSCVSVTLWHSKKKIGGMCHFALPASPEDCNGLNPRFANKCFLLFERSAGRYNTSMNEFEAKIFGGGNMYSKTALHNLDAVQRLPIGEKNVLAAYSELSARNVDIKVAHVGEFGYRKIIFDVDSGDVWVKFTPLNDLGDQRSLTGKT